MPSQKPLNFESPAPRPINRGTMDYSRDHHADLPIEDWRSSLMEKKIDLYNFEGCAAEESSYILTSPRSLRACARMKIQPVELLAKPETDFEEELLTSGQQPGEASRKLYDAHERARLRKLYMCRRAREEIIQEDGGDERIEVIDNAKLLFQGMNKPPERTLKHTANGIDHSRVIIPKSGQGNSNLRPGASPRPPSHPPTRPPHSRSSATSKTSSTSSPRTPSTSSPRTPSSKTRSSGTTPSSTGGRRNPNPGDLPPRLLKRSASMPPTSRQRPQSAVSSGSSHRSSSRTPLSQRLVLDGSERPSRSSSRSRPYSANLPERDQRILDCMVFKREQERDELRHQRVASKVWDEERRKEEKIRMENELQRRKNLVERELDRQKKRERMQKQRDKEEKEKLKEFEMSLKYKDAKHVQMASQQDLLKIQQIDIKKQAEKTKKEKQV
ncbi:coiled-coil domain-containing protein 177 [Strongylocentrotus purpuratus]|uniref:Uncharacterized protein n=1 Tax=Strongylocentrotus purpuratus TaxID=7668 RepID=A0A7M7NGL1_STRPU|nr:coiled-coil domain-containing protein 177 [Strongylocentrotus purpuratus]